MSTRLDLRGLQREIIQASCRPPGQAAEGAIYFNTSDKTCYVRCHGRWVPFSSEAKPVETVKQVKACRYCGGYDQEVARHRCVGCGAPMAPGEGTKRTPPPPPPPPGPYIVKCA